MGKIFRAANSAVSFLLGPAAVAVSIIVVWLFFIKPLLGTLFFVFVVSMALLIALELFA